MWIPVLLACLAITQVYSKTEEVYRWKVLDVDWPSEEIKSKTIKDGGYVPENNALAGIKVWKDQMFLTVPRWKSGVPVTLGVVPISPVDGDREPKLKAYPNWQSQEVGNCQAFQFVQSMEIDPYGRMWVLDSGRTETLADEPIPRCPPRLVILDIEDGGKVLRVHEFPEHVTPRKVSYLNDLVLDSTGTGYAYISDTSEKDPGLIVYSLKDNLSWKIRHPSMEEDKDARKIVSSGATVEVDFPVDGIALSGLDEADRLVYYCPLAAYDLYALPTSVLKQNVTDVDEHVQRLGRKSSQTDGMIMTADGRLYFGLVAEEAVAVWDVSQETLVSAGEEIATQNHQTMLWPDTFALDEEGYMFFVANSLQNFIEDEIDSNKYNFRVFKTDVGSKSYQFHQNGGTPPKMNV
uniref:Uncharacterized protein n=1 Tax=Bracon brevicornis TaxID=1563983 RepID=A0A6V7K5K3_9HYME